MALQRIMPCVEQAQQSRAVRNDVGYGEIVEDNEKRPQSPLNATREMAMPLERACICFRVKTFHQFQWSLGPSQYLPNGNLLRWSGQTHPTFASAQGFNIAALTEVISDLHQMRP